MARDRNYIHEAIGYFKDAMRIDNDNSDAWLLIGTLHLSQNEWGPAKRKFERVLMVIFVIYILFNICILIYPKLSLFLFFVL